MLDDNVPLQQPLLLLQSLLQAGTSQHLELMLYPEEGHGFTAGSAWLDEFERIDRLFTEHLHLH